MAKACLNKLNGNILTDCTLRSHGIKELYLMYAQDVTFASVASATEITAANFVAGARSYRVEGYKQNIQMTSSLRTTDASAKLDVSITFKSIFSGALFGGISAGRFYVMVVYHDSAGVNEIWGFNTPLECSNVEYDSNANGRMVTYTLAAPEGSTGNNAVATSPEAAATIISKSV